MDPVVFAWQDNVPVLQEDNPARKTKVGVRPLVNLVCQGSKYSQGKDVTLPRARLV